MKTDKKWDVLFIEDKKSMFDLGTQVLDILFNKVEIVSSKDKALELYDANKYDIVISDISVEPERVALLKQIKDKKTEQTIFALVSPKDTDKLFGISDLGIHAFELTPPQFEQALEAIAQFNPYE